METVGCRNNSEKEKSQDKKSINSVHPTLHICPKGFVWSALQGRSVLDFRQ